MIVQVHNRGTGRGSGPVQYLLGRENDRDQATLLRGDPDLTTQLIDSSKYAKKYTSIVLSFEEADLPEQAKAEIMDGFERALFAGLDADQYNTLWVQHQDKGRLELNVVVPNLELLSGKRLQPYYDRADRPRVNAWKDTINIKYGLHDPNDPLNAQTLTLPHDLPKASQKASEAITEGLLALASQGLVKSRNDVIQALEQGGFEIARITKTSISIKAPEGGRNIRLKGALYAQDFKHGPELRADIEAASERYRASAPERLQAAERVLSQGLERKRSFHQERFPRPEPQPERARASLLVMDGVDHHPDRRDELRGPVVDWAADRREPRHHPEPGASDQAAQSRGRGPQVEQVRRAAVREDRPRSAAVSRGLQDTGGLLNDRTGADAVGVIGRIIERARAAARGLADRLQAESGLGAAGERLERAGVELGRATQEYEKNLSRERALSSDKGRGWSGPSLG